MGVHLQRAKDVLQRFDVVLSVGDKFNEKVNWTLGWRCPDMTSRVGSTLQFVRDLQAAWSRDDWDLLLRHNALDAELIAHAAMLEQVDMRVFSHPAFLGELGACTDGMCG